MRHLHVGCASADQGAAPCLGGMAKRSVSRLGSYRTAKCHVRVNGERSYTPAQRRHASPNAIIVALPSIDFWPLAAVPPLRHSLPQSSRLSALSVALWCNPPLTASPSEPWSATQLAPSLCLPVGRKVSLGVCVSYRTITRIIWVIWRAAIAPTRHLVCNQRPACRQLVFGCLLVALGVVGK